MCKLRLILFLISFLTLSLIFLRKATVSFICQLKSVSDVLPQKNLCFRFGTRTQTQKPQKKTNAKPIPKNPKKQAPNLNPNPKTPKKSPKPKPQNPKP